jgi:hypothetical protein
VERAWSFGQAAFAIDQVARVDPALREHPQRGSEVAAARPYDRDLVHDDGGGVDFQTARIGALQDDGAARAHGLLGEAESTRRARGFHDDVRNARRNEGLVDDADARGGEERPLPGMTRHHLDPRSRGRE